MSSPAEAGDARIRPTGEQIRLVREALGWPKTVFADVLGVSWFTVFRWERGRSRMSPLGLRNFRALLAKPQVQQVLADKMRLEAEARAGRASAA